MASGVKQGDEVIIPNYTMVATLIQLKFWSYPVFVDVEPDTLCLDIDAARKAISSKTKAIMLVSANGRYPKAGIEAFESLATENGLVLIEDAAQALGSLPSDGRHIGRAGLVGSFSFCTKNNINRSRRCLITDCDTTAKHLRRLKDFEVVLVGVTTSMTLLDLILNLLNYKRVLVSSK